MTREELQTAVWGSQTFVDHENGLNWCVRKVREGLGDNPLTPRFVETLPKRGYRFIAAIDEPRTDYVPPQRRHGFQRHPLAISVALLIALAIGVWLLPRNSLGQHRRTVVVLPFDNLTGSADRDFLATAATDQIITGIGSTGTVNVIDRATAAKFKRTEECIIRIGEQLQADFVVEGSLVGPADSPTIAAGVYRVRDNTRLWAGQLPAGVDRGTSAYRFIAAKVTEIAE